MVNVSDFLVVLGMFALRIGVPVAVTALLVYLLKRLDRRWEAEARIARGEITAEPAATPSQREAPVGRPTLPARRQPLPSGAMAATSQPCWDLKSCSEALRKTCPACKEPERPCWQARLSAEGRIPETCVDCTIFQRYPLA